ncbi:hypothetical protein BH18THE2_BH18THE2_20940 [soil metagenome]
MSICLIYSRTLLKEGQLFNIYHVVARLCVWQASRFLQVDDLSMIMFTEHGLFVGRKENCGHRTGVIINNFLPK